MVFNKHENLEGLHAPFGASKSSWLRYTDEKALAVYENLRAAEKGTLIHEWAKSKNINDMKSEKDLDASKLKIPQQEETSSCLVF